MIHRLALTAVWSAAALLVACSSSGSTDYDPGQVPSARPQWVDRLQERVAPVPPEVAPESVRLATPTEWLTDPSTRGKPKDLTSRIAPSRRGSSGNRHSPPAAPGGSSITATETEAETTVTVTVNNELLTDLEELRTRSKPSPGEPPSALESMYAGRLELQPRR